SPATRPGSCWQGSPRRRADRGAAIRSGSLPLLVLPVLEVAALAPEMVALLLASLLLPLRVLRLPRCRLIDQARPRRPVCIRAVEWCVACMTRLPDAGHSVRTHRGSREETSQNEDAV